MATPESWCCWRSGAVGGAGARIPADEIVAALDFKGRAGPCQTSDQLSIEIRQVFEMLADKSGSPQIMVMVKQKAPQIIVAAIDRACL